MTEAAFFKALANGADASGFSSSWRVLDNAPAASILVGSYAYDSASAKFTMRWASDAEFRKWLIAEQAAKCIELREKEHVKAKTAGCGSRTRFVCARKGTGGLKKYDKKHPERQRKIPNKRTDCPASLVVKHYPDSPTVLGTYNDDHNHEIGGSNLRFTRVSNDTRDHIASLLRLNVSPTAVLQQLHGDIHDGFEVDEMEGAPRREDHIELRDIRRIQKRIEAEEIRLDPDDGKSILLWVQRLRPRDAVLGFKARNDPSPPGSNVPTDAFLLMLQTNWQRKMFEQYGRAMLFIDATHNMTMYENLLLTTIMVRDSFGHGLPVAWMMASYATQEVLGWFVATFHSRNPIVPKFLMTDFDQAQINALTSVYLSESIILLCWWHVLNAWQKRVNKQDYAELWSLLKAWIRITDAALFRAQWVKIQAVAPQAFVDYLNGTWMSEQMIKRWSGVYRKERTIFEASDTNMTVESYHHVVKGKFFEGKHNHRMDHLAYTLLFKVLPHYKLRQHRQQLGFEGEDLEVRKRQDITKRAESIAPDKIKLLADDLYNVESQSTPQKMYKVDLNAYTCTCLDFPLVSFCKHLCAVQNTFPSTSSKPIPSTSCPPSESGTSDSSDQNTDELPVPAVPSPVVITPASTRPVKATAEKLERLAARLRRPQAKPFPSLQSLDDALDLALQQSDTGGVLPPARYVRLNATTDWADTQQRIMPGVKSSARARAKAKEVAMVVASSAALSEKVPEPAKKKRKRATKTITQPSIPAEPSLSTSSESSLRPTPVPQPPMMPPPQQAWPPHASGQFSFQYPYIPTPSTSFIPSIQTHAPIGTPNFASNRNNYYYYPPPVQNSQDSRYIPMYYYPAPAPSGS